MALLYQANKTKKITKNLTARIQDLDYQGLGVAKIQGKTYFVENALPDEQVEFRVCEEKRQYGRGVAINIQQPSSARITPKCQYYGHCGGCQSQHIYLNLQQQAKQTALFRRLQKLQPDIQQKPMIVGESWAYRRRIRLSMQFNPKIQQLDLGFRECDSNRIVNITNCDVAVREINQILPALGAICQQWSVPQSLGHWEIVAADNGIALFLRHLGEVTCKDRILLEQLARQYHLMLFVQCADQVEHWAGEVPEYQIDELKLQFDVRDFIQVNRQLNITMVKTALDWLALTSQDRVLDLFCGMGNFTLPLAQKVQSAVGIEGVLPMVEKARHNAQQNGIANAHFFQADLDQPFIAQSWAHQPFDKILLDPPRSGAAFALPALCQLQASKVLYVSCNPATLVRDAEILLQAGYRIQQTAMIDMFPHTRHLESMTLFER